ncbi:MAG TPA: molybdenum cofactor guanylyltransferase [Solirubrobacteraceae bacterium]
MARRGPIGAVLAGGTGRHIGGDKATIELAGRPLLHYPLNVARASLGEVAVVAKTFTVLPALDPDVTIWLEPEAPRHPLAGVVHALMRARGRPVIVIGGDMPFVNRALVSALVRERPRGAPAVVPRAGGRLEPLCARYEQSALALLTAFDPGVAPEETVGTLEPRLLDWPEHEPFFKVNRPEDLLQAAALLDTR